MNIGGNCPDGVGRSVGSESAPIGSSMSRSVAAALVAILAVAIAIGVVITPASAEDRRPVALGGADQEADPEHHIHDHGDGHEHGGDGHEHEHRHGPGDEPDLAYAAGDDRMLVRLYAAYFGRAPDQEGFGYWRGQLIGGSVGEQVSEAFAGSTEFVNRYGTLTDAAFVSLVYRNVLGREAEPEGHAYWVGELERGESRGEVMLGFSESAEFTRLTNHIPTPYAPPLTSYESRGLAALAAIDYDWRAKLPGWSIEFRPQRSGYYGLTYPSSKRIVVYVRASQSDGHLAHVVAHEIGHAVDVSLNSSQDRQRWRIERGIDPTWWPGNGLSDFRTGAGDFAESFAYWQVGDLSGMFQSRLAGVPDAGDRALLSELSAG